MLPVISERLPRCSLPASLPQLVAYGDRRVGTGMGPCSPCYFAMHTGLQSMCAMAFEKATTILLIEMRKMSSQRVDAVLSEGSLV